ncbi:phosphoglycerate mutase-like protein [Poronia punctata]|nr:phosphoglycerate mutase-like protein [Poronia punctata]
MSSFKKKTILSLATLSTPHLITAAAAATTETIQGIFIFSRHGFRTPKILPPTNLTPLGIEQVYATGQYYRDRYISSNATFPIHGLEEEEDAEEQIDVKSPKDNVLYDSATEFLRGLYYPGDDDVRVNTLSSSSVENRNENDVWLQGSSNCANAAISSEAYRDSDEYAETYASSKDFYEGLRGPFLENVDVEASFDNAYAIYDYLSFSSSSSSSNTNTNNNNKNKNISDSDMKELKRLADIHEYNLAFNKSDTARAVAGKVLAGEILAAFEKTGTQGGKLFNVQFGPYATFSSFFGLVGFQEGPRGVVDYASTMVFELFTTTAEEEDDLFVRFLFANGPLGRMTMDISEENELVAYPLFGQREVAIPWERFRDEMERIAIRGVGDWCAVCGSSSSSEGGEKDICKVSTIEGGGNYGEVSVYTAGAIGALVALFVVLVGQTLVFLLAGLRVVKKSSLRGYPVGEKI